VVFREEEDRTSFDVRRHGVSLGISRLWQPLRLGLIYNYRLVEERLEQPDADVPRESQDARVASLTPTLLFDRRDDPIDPTRGWSAAFDVERAFPLFAADADFTKAFGQVTVAVPAFGFGTLAASARGGLLWPHALPEDGVGGAIDAVPVSELFYAGGRTTHRAFRRDELGVPGETIVVDEDGDPFPLGGGGLALLNLDWRFPIAGAFGGNVFVDGGNVWREEGDVDLSEVRWGAGVGLRYASPLGPLRAEIGWKLDRESFEDPWVVSISLGNPF
jgi:outer membrane protein assembly factor BamA